MTNWLSEVINQDDQTVLSVAGAEREPRALVFQLPRDRLFVKVHQRMNVRVLELVEGLSSSGIELEGNRRPLTDSEDVIDVLTEL